MNVTLTEAEAVAAYTKIVKGLGEAPHSTVVAQGGGAWPAGPVLCRNFESWTSTTEWAVVWEGGPDDWPFIATTEGMIETSGDVFVEPINGYSLGLYRD